MENGMDGDTAQLSQLGCAVIGVFAKLDEMKGQDEVVQRIPTLIAVLQQQYENPFLQERLIKDLRKMDVIRLIRSKLSQQRKRVPM